MASLPIEVAIAILGAVFGLVTGSVIPWLKERYARQLKSTEIVITSPSGEKQRVLITEDMGQKEINAKLEKAVHEEQG